MTGRPLRPKTASAPVAEELVHMPTGLDDDGHHDLGTGC